MAANNNINDQVYNVREDDALSSHVAGVVCVLVQRGMMVAGFSNTKELLTIHYMGYTRTKPVWELDFFEQMCNSGILLAGKEKIKGVFICTDKNLVVPAELYEKRDARNWLKEIHFIEEGDNISATRLDGQEASYVMAVPVKITELVKINFKKSATLPLPVYQFRDLHVKQGLSLQCCLSQEQTCAALHHNGQLLWHKVFGHSCAEDIAYETGHACREHGLQMQDATLLCNAVSAAEYDTIAELSRYFPGTKAGNGHAIKTRWDAAISLAQQLYSCVS